MAVLWKQKEYENKKITKNGIVFFLLVLEFFAKNFLSYPDFESTLTLSVQSENMPKYSNYLGSTYSINVQVFPNLIRKSLTASQSIYHWRTVDWMWISKALKE